MSQDYYSTFHIEMELFPLNIDFFISTCTINIQNNLNRGEINDIFNSMDCKRN